MALDLKPGDIGLLIAGALARLILARCQQEQGQLAWPHVAHGCSALKTLLLGSTVAGLLPPSAPAPPPRSRPSSGPHAAHTNASSSASSAITKCCLIFNLALIVKYQ